MESKEILEFCIQKGLLVDKEILNLFSETNDMESVKLIIEKIKSHTQERIITRNLFDQNKEQVYKIHWCVIELKFFVGCSLYYQANAANKS